jgi:transcriptional regulator with XRE-family HTH domain
MSDVFTSAGELFAIIETKRKEQGVSQRELSKRAGLSHGAYWFVAQRGGDLTIDSALRYTSALGLELKAAKKRGRR